MRCRPFTVSQAIAVFNQILDTATPTIVVTGEVANFKINQGKWVFFDLKDDTGILKLLYGAVEFANSYRGRHESIGSGAT